MTILVEYAGSDLPARASHGAKNVAERLLAYGVVLDQLKPSSQLDAEIESDELLESYRSDLDDRMVLNDLKNIDLFRTLGPARSAARETDQISTTFSVPRSVHHPEAWCMAYGLAAFVLTVAGRKLRFIPNPGDFLMLPGRGESVEVVPASDSAAALVRLTPSIEEQNSPIYEAVA